MIDPFLNSSTNIDCDTALYSGESVWYSLEKSQDSPTLFAVFLIDLVYSSIVSRHKLRNSERS